MNFDSCTPGNGGGLRVNVYQPRDPAHQATRKSLGAQFGVLVKAFK